MQVDALKVTLEYFHGSRHLNSSWKSEPLSFTDVFLLKCFSLQSCGGY